MLGQRILTAGNYDDDQKLKNSKKGVVDDEADFEQTAEKYFTSYYKVLVLWVNELRRVVFPGGTRRKKPDKSLYIQMKKFWRRHLRT